MEAARAKAHRAHRFLVPTLFVIATLVGFAATFAVWVNRQALNTDNWAHTSSKLLANDEITTALGAYLVNQLYTNVDVPGAIAQKLPPQAKGLAGPAAAAVRQVADRAAPRLLATPQVQNLWVTANRAAHKTLIKIIDGGNVVSTEGGKVTLNLRSLVDQLAANLGVEEQVSAARSKAQQTGITLPPKTGQLTIMSSDQLGTAQDVAGAVKGLALVLPALAIALFALAIWLARDRRRRALRTSGWCFVAIGVLLLLIRRVAGNQIVDGLVKVDSNKPAVHEVWNIATSLLYAIAVAFIVYGIVIALSAWLAGPTRPATFIRKALAPGLRDHPATAYAGVGGVLLILIAWGPTPAFRQIAWIILFAVLLALGVTMLRRQTEEEFPGVQRGDAMRDFRERRHVERVEKAATTLEEIERLVALHDSGNLDDSEFAAAKGRVVNGG
jgi:hypothetical protein